MLNLVQGIWFKSDANDQEFDAIETAYRRTDLDVSEPELARNIIRTNLSDPVPDRVVLYQGNKMIRELRKGRDYSIRWDDDASPAPSVGTDEKINAHDAGGES